jgi:hypothetical protein
LLIWPVLWIAYTFVHGAITGWYPYPFLDATDIGFGAALRNALAVLVAAAVVAWVAKVVDRKLKAAPVTATGAASESSRQEA